MSEMEVLMRCPLFGGIAAGELSALMACLSAMDKRAEKGEYLIAAGDAPGRIGIVLTGSVHIIQEDYWGGRSILARIGPSGLFGEALAFSDAKAMPVSAVAAEPTTVRFVDASRMSKPCDSACAFHFQLIENMLGILAGKNMLLTKRMEHLTCPTTREKLMSYLSDCAKHAGQSAFDIPFSRQELADYLSVDRSALSNELSKMRRDGLLEFEKAHFVLLGSRVEGNN